MKNLITLFKGNNSSLEILFLEMLRIFNSFKFSKPVIISIKFPSKFNLINFDKLYIFSINLILLYDKFKIVSCFALSRLSM